MSDNFFSLSLEEQLTLISKAGDRFNVSDMIIEKDLWICWLLEKIFSLSMQMAFKEGLEIEINNI